MASPSPKAREKPRSGPWKWIALAVAAGALVVAARLLPLAGWLTGFNRQVQELGPVGILLFIAVYVLATVLFFPGSLLTLGAGFAFGVGWGLAAVSIGSTIGAACAFLIGRHLARATIHQKAAAYPKFGAIDRAVGREGWKIVLLLRLSPLVPFNLQNYLYGLTAIAFWPYVLASWLGMLPGTLLYVYLGAAGRAGLEAAAGQAGRSPWEVTLFVAGLLATVAVTFYVTHIARKAIRASEPDQAL